MIRRIDETDAQSVDLRAGARMTSRLLILVVLVAGGLVFLVLRSRGGGDDDAKPATETAVDAGFNYGRHATSVKILRLQLERAPCDRGSARDLVRTLNQAGDYQGTIAFAREYHEHCEFYPRLLWNVSNAHQELGEYQQSAEVITALIKGRPRDSDFWWWRGEDYARLDEIDLADADYRQSMANKPNVFAARRYLPLMGERTPCEVAAAIQTMIEQRPDQVAQWMRDTLSDRHVSGNCDRVKGTGRVEIAVADSAPVIESEAVINGQTGRFLIQQKSAFTVLTSNFAERSNPSRTTVEIPVYAAGAFVTGQRAILDTVSVGEASAPKVVSVVVDKLPGEIDGIIGASFLWRFRVEELPALDGTPGKLIIAGR